MIENGALNGQKCLNKILQKIKGIAAAIVENFIFIDDNTRCHRTHVVNACLEENQIEKMY